MLGSVVQRFQWAPVRNALYNYGHLPFNIYSCPVFTSPSHPRIACPRSPARCSLGLLCVTDSSVLFQVNSVNCNTSWKIVLFMKWGDNQEVVLKGVRLPRRVAAVPPVVPSTTGTPVS